jgi:hypothetical protein
MDRKSEAGARRRLITVAGATMVAVLLPALRASAMPINDPTGLGLFAIGTAGEPATGDVAVSNGGAASGVVSVSNGSSARGGVAVSNGGSAGALLVAVSIGGSAATPTCTPAYVDHLLICVPSVGSVSVGNGALSGGSPDDSTALVAVQGSPAAAAAVTGTEAAQAPCATANVAISATGPATSCGGVSVSGTGTASGGVVNVSGSSLPLP